MKKAIITGITGQDGSYLAELLLSKGYSVLGILRRASSFSTSRIDHLYGNPNFNTVYGDLTCAPSLYRIFNDFKPDEIYNLGAMSQVWVSFGIPKYTIETNTLGVLNMLEYLRDNKHIKFYQASSSEMFGATPSKPPFNEDSIMRPQSPYGVSKLAAYHLVRIYAQSYGVFATTGILFNHESERRGENFVSRKITQAIGRIKAGLQSKLFLGNVWAYRDWGYSPDYMEAIYAIMQHDKPDVFVISTGETHTIQEFVEEAFGYAGLDWKKYVEIDPQYKRPSEVPYLQGDSTKATTLLGWEPKHKFKDVVRLMVDHDTKNVAKEINFDNYHRGVI